MYTFIQSTACTYKVSQYRWAFARQRPRYDIQQNIRNTSINFIDGEMTMIFIRDIISTDVNNDTDLSRCVYLLRAWGGDVTNFTSPALFNKHVNNDVFNQQICLQDCVGKSFICILPVTMETSNLYSQSM